MAFKRSAVRSRLSPPKPDFFGNQVFFFTLRVFQANKQQQFDPAYLHQTPTERLEFFLYLESLSGIETITGPAKSYRVIARSEATWQSPAGMWESEECPRRLPRPCGLAMTAVVDGWSCCFSAVGIGGFLPPRWGGGRFLNRPYDQPFCRERL